MSDIKADYGYVAWRYFAWMGVIGIVGVVIALWGSTLLAPWNLVVGLFGSIVGAIGLWIGGSYLILYPRVFSTNPSRNHMVNAAFATGITGHEQILDIGCGTGRVSIEMAEILTDGKVTGIDIYEGVSGTSPVSAIRNARAKGVADRTEFKHGNVLDLPFEDSTFDVVTMGSVLHEMHGENLEKKALSEVKRVLKPDGRLIVFELTRNLKMFAAMLFLGLVWKSREYWFSRLEEMDFEVLREEYISNVIDATLFVATPV